jgi:hypothetical protein
MNKISLNLNGRVGRITKLLGAGELWDGDKIGMNLAWCPVDIPDDQLSAGALRYRRGLELYIAAVCLLVRYRHKEEEEAARLQMTVEAFGFDCPWEELTSKEIIQGALDAAEELGLTVPELEWLDSALRKRVPVDPDRI